MPSSPDDVHVFGSGRYLCGYKCALVRQPIWVGAPGVLLTFDCPRAHFYRAYLQYEQERQRKRELKRKRIQEETLPPAKRPRKDM